MKICSKCKEEKELDKFYINKWNKKDGKSSYCKECMNIYIKSDFQNKKDEYNKRMRLWKRDKYKWYRDLKDSLECEKCGFKHPAVIDFHHKNPNDKEFDIGNIIKNQLTLEKVMNEIEKCIVLCSNCHRIEHWNIEEEKFKNKFI